MLKDEFEQLMALFRKSAEGHKVDLHEIFSKSLAFFQHLKDEFEHASPEEKQELTQLLQQINKEVMQESKALLKNAGMTEEQLLDYADNPSNFSPEQWKEFQESKSQIHKAGMQLFKEVQKVVQHPTNKPHTVQPIEKKESAGHKKSRRSDWKRT